MRFNISTIALVWLLVGCGSGGDGGAGGAPVTPVSPPSPPAPTYKKYAELTGDQAFKSACSSLVLGVVPFMPRGLTAFENGLNLSYTGSNNTYAVSGDGVTSTYGPGELDPTAPMGTQRYTRVVNGFTERFLIAQPSVNGINLDYMRVFTLLTQASSSAPSVVSYTCIFGVPTQPGDAPAGSNIPFVRVALNGAAYIAENGVNQSYSLTGSTATFAANVTNGAITITLQLVGVLQTPTGPSGGSVSLGEYRGTGGIGESQRTFAGSMNDVTSATPTMVGNFGGWFFGPKGAESGTVLVMTGTQPGTGRRMTVTGTITAFQR